MSTINIQDLVIDRQLDCEAMSDIAGSGLWGTISKAARRVGGYAKRTYRRKVSQFRQIYHTVRSVPGALYSSPRLLYRSAKDWF